MINSTAARAVMARATTIMVLALALAACTRAPTPAPPAVQASIRPVVNAPAVFLIVMENHDWGHIKGSPAAPYINSSLLPAASYASNYYGPSNLHPSLPNYIWLQAGTNFGITDDGSPGDHPLATHYHLTDLLDAVGVPWKAYEEGISGTGCPTSDSGNYAVRHDPFVYFTDSISKAYCVRHVRPFSQLAHDLRANRVSGYNFITPDLCHDMHTACSPLDDQVRQGDTWLAHTVPMILRSAAYRRNGVLFITWDENEDSTSPIGLIALSPRARGHGYISTVRYTHSSLLRTIEEIYRVHPMLGNVARSNDLSALFTTLP